jgi:hypothetical protein
MKGLPVAEPEQNCQDRAARTGLPAQDCKDTTRADQKGEDSRKGQACKTGESVLDLSTVKLAV